MSKFDGTNFLGWKFQLNAILVTYGLDDIVLGTRAVPGDSATPELKKAWTKDNAKAMYLISSSMEYAQLESLLVYSTAKQMWDALNRIHAQNSVSNRLILTQRFHEYRMEPTDTVVQHVAKVQNMASQLLDLGENISNMTIMAKILASLTSKFSTLQTAWDSVAPERQTLENLQERLIKEESRLNAEGDEMTALAATRNFREKAGSSRRREDSKFQGDKKGRREKKKTEVECYCCRERGHFARDCPTRKQQRGDHRVEPRNCALVAAHSKQGSDGRQKRARKTPSAEQTRRLLSADSRDVWFVDSGASKHITHRREWFADFRSSRGSTISLGDDGECEVAGEGTVPVEKLVDGVWRETRLENVLYVPEVRKNLLSVGVWTTKGFELSFFGTEVQVVKNNEIIATGVKQSNEIYRMFLRLKSAENCENEVNVSTTSFKVWHERLGHLNKQSLSELVNNELVNGVKLANEKDFFCDACQLGKSHRLPFKTNDQKEVRTKPGEFTHSDVCGPMSVTSLGGARFFVTFIDDASGFRHVYFIKHKSDVFDRFKEYERMITNKFGRPMKVLRSDNGREYCNGNMKDYLTSKGIRLETSAPYTPEQNGKAERDNRTIVECARTMLTAKDLPTFLWAEAVNTAVYLQNRILSSDKRGGKTPSEIWTGEKPDLSHTKIFGSEAFANIPKQFLKKFDARSTKVFFVGYQGDSTNYRVYNPDTKSVSVSRNVVFHEYHDKPESLKKNKKEVTLSIGDVSEVEEGPLPDDQKEPDTIIEEGVPKREDTGRPRPPVFEQRQLRDRLTLRGPVRYEANLAEYETPTTFREAVTGKDSLKWKDAIREELVAHRENNT